MDILAHPIVQSLIVALIALIVILPVAWILSRVLPDWKIKQRPETPIQFAKIIEEQEGLGAGTIVAGLMLIIFSFVSAGMYANASTVFQEIAALLIWIGNCAFWGIFIIAGAIGCKKTHIVYSDVAVNLEKNIARLEKLQEEASSVNAVADAVSPDHTESLTTTVHKAKTTTVDEAERFPLPDKGG